MKIFAFGFLVLVLMTSSAFLGIYLSSPKEKKISVSETEIRQIYQKGKQDTVDAVLNGFSGRDSVLIGKDCSAPLDDKEWRYIYLGNKASPLNVKNAPLFILNNEVGENVVTIDKEGAVIVNKEKFTAFFQKPKK